MDLETDYQAVAAREVGGAVGEAAPDLLQFR